MNTAVGLIVLVLFATSQAIDWSKKLSKPIDCGVSAWSDWKCVGSQCGRTRVVLRHPKNGGQACPDLTETKPSNSKEDPWSKKGVDKKVQSTFISGRQRYVSFAKSAQQPGGKTLLARDLMFILDASGSISKEEFHKTKQKMAEMIELICGTIGKTRQHNRISVITFSDIVTLNFDFDDYFDIEPVKKAIMKMPQRRSTTCTGDALHMAHTTMFDPKHGVRDATESVKEVVVVTDGQSNCGKDLAVEVKKLQVKAFVFALAIGRFTPKGKAEIESMVSRPLLDHIFSLSNFQKFFEMVDALKTFPDVCVPFELSR